MSDSYIKLQSTFLRWVSRNVPLTLILLFDEARSLCEISAYDGKRVVDYSNYSSRNLVYCRISYPALTTLRAIAI